MSPLEQARAALESALVGQANASRMTARACAEGSYTRGEANGEARAYMHASRLVDQIVVEIARLSALTPPDETEWARVIDPEAWSETLPNRYRARQRAALAKARTLIGMAGGVKA